MDIKNIGRNILPFTPKSVKDADGVGARVKAETTDDRDANGQMAGEQKKKQAPVTTEELEEAIKYLEELPGVKDHLLAVRIERNDEGIPSILVVDRTGKIVRRIPESEIGQILLNREKKSGHLLNKAL
jgi:uncharacterized FlaG/YvyC family protein